MGKKYEKICIKMYAGYFKEIRESKFYKKQIFGTGSEN